MKNWKIATLTLAAAAMMSTGCAQDVGDIDRTQPDALLKADFEGDQIWYVRQTVTDVPATLAGPFVGVSSSMEKVRWEITKDLLIAYRAYEQIPGYDQKAGDIVDGQTTVADGQGQGADPELYKEEPIAAFPITHFDIQRSYNSSTGEQSNVIVENSSDRHWSERKYMRVNWAADMITTSYPDFLANFQADISRWVTQNDEDTVDAWYTERNDEGELSYFDFTTRPVVQGNELEIRSSFARLDEPQRDYEPAFYNDEMMTKFGYFRTERYVYERDLGFTDSGRIYLANRHDLWKNDYRRDENGEYVRDADGRRIPTPMAEREPKPVVYYLSPNYPEQVMPGAEGVAKDWDRAFTRSVAAAKGMTPDEINEKFGPMFVLCHNPVKDADPTVCDPRTEQQKAEQDNEPYSARAGDVRKSFFFWVHQPQASGPLGYGPSFPDPETGEIISGTAYVYGAGVDRLAGSGVDIVRLANGDLTEEQVRNGDGRLARILNQRRFDIDPRGSMTADMIDKIPATELNDLGEGLMDTDKLRKFEQIREGGLEPLEATFGKREAAFDALKEAGFDRLLMDDEYVRAMSGGKLQMSDATPEQLAQMRQEKNPFDLKQVAQAQNERVDMYARNNVYLEEFADEAVMGTALEFKGETDYDKVWNELRNRVFRGVMAHEVGHTLGLRHNFQGSWDSVNYFDDYWEMRKENFRVPETIQDLYDVNRLTQNQIEGDMTRYEYSSIMDYHSRFNSDTSGIGKYDEAAILFAYSFGTYDDIPRDNTEPITAVPGYVEVFTDVPQSVEFGGQNVDTRAMLHSYDDRYAASQHPLEDLHYTTLVTLMGGPDALKNRKLVSYDELQKQQQNDVEDRPIEVPYMFCSDEWVGAAISCDRWDLGADPFEKVQWAVKGYNEYYPLTHFRRDRLTFGINSVLNRAYRTYGTMPSVFQRWFFNQYYSSDQTLSNYFTLASFAGFNFLARQLSTPSYGAYQWDPDNEMYELVSLDPDYADSDLRVDYGEGKAIYSDYADDGYYYFTRIQSVGNYWEKTVAMQMLAASSTTTVLGADVQADFRSYILPYYLVFEDELTDVFNGMYLSDYSAVSPYAGDKGVRLPTFAPLVAGNDAFDPLTGETLPANTSERQIRTNINFSQRINAMIYGVAFFSSAYSPNYLDQARVWRLGAGNGLQTPEMLCRQQGLGEECATATHELITYTDVNSGVTYATIKDTTAEEPTVAVELVEYGQYLQGIAEETTDADTRSSALRALEDNTEDVVILLEAVDTLGSVLF